MVSSPCALSAKAHKAHIHTFLPLFLPTPLVPAGSAVPPPIDSIHRAGDKRALIPKQKADEVSCLFRGAAAGHGRWVGELLGPRHGLIDTFHHWRGDDAAGDVGS